MEIIECVIVAAVVLIYLFLSWLAAKERNEYERKAKKAVEVLNNFAEGWNNVYYGDKSMRHSNEMYKSLKMISTLDGDRFASMEAKEVLAKIGGDDETTSSN